MKFLNLGGMYLPILMIIGISLLSSALHRGLRRQNVRTGLCQQGSCLSLIGVSSSASFGSRSYMATTSTDADEIISSEERVFNPGSDKRPKQKEALKLKVRQHVNPLSEAYQKPIELAGDWLDQAFGNKGQDMIVDVGCAKGTWILKNAEEHKNKNYLGLEIRRPVVDYCNERTKRWGLTNAHFLSTNANIDLPIILRDLIGKGINIDMITIHHPDPHFKKRHKKRRVVTPELVDELAQIVKSNCKIFLQSDIEDVAQDMSESFLENSSYRPADGYDRSRLEGNPSPHTVMTEREIATLNKGLPVFRMLVQRV